MILEIFNITFLILLVFSINFLFNHLNFLKSYTGQNHQIYIQKTKIPLSGGLIILLYFLFNFYDQKMILILFLSLFYLIGLIGDLNILRSVTLRFLIQISLITVFVIFFEINISDLRVEYLNLILKNNYFNVFFVIFCFLVLINGSNFVDGNNGLAIGYYLIIFIFLLYLINSNQIMYDRNTILPMISCLSVLIIFNLMNKLFLGDNGVYVLSVFTGLTLIDMSNLNYNISPYFVVTLLWYPVFEILFSMIRKICSKVSPMLPDTKHFHQLLFFYINKKFKYSTEIKNSLVGIAINIYNFLLFALAILYFEKSNYQIIILIMNILIYLIIYYFLNNFKKKLNH